MKKPGNGDLFRLLHPGFLLSIEIQNRDFNFCNIVLDSADYQIIDPNLIGIAGEL